MARKKVIKISANIADTCVYKRNGKLFTRKRNPITSERVLEDAEFEKTRQYSAIFGKASKIASPVYKELNSSVKARWIFRIIAGEAASLLYQGKSEEEAGNILRQKYIDQLPAQSTRQYLESILKDRWKSQGRSGGQFNEAWSDPAGWDKKQPFQLEDLDEIMKYFKPFFKNSYYAYYQLLRQSHAEKLHNLTDHLVASLIESERKTRERKKREKNLKTAPKPEVQ
jgi:hypothetical protein